MINKIEQIYNKQAFDKKELDSNDFWILRDNPVTKEGIFPYMGYQISPDIEPDKIYHVFRPLEEIASPEALESLKTIPFINEHTMLGNKQGYSKPEDKGIEGVTGTNPKIDESSKVVTVDLKVFSENLKDLIENGKKELSLGYTCDYEAVNNPDYDFIQKNIRYNHLALVDEGRMGHDVRVMDKKNIYDNVSTKENETMETKDVDKREQIREIMAIASKPDSDFEGGENEKIDTIAKKLEEIAYNPSETGANDEEESKLEVTQDPDDPNKIEVEIKEDDKVLDEDEDKEKTIDEEKCQDADEDKRKLIDEIGGILKDKVDEEILRTILKKAEELAYNPSETGANDECNEEEKPATMDSAIKYIAKRDDLVNKIRPHIGDNVNYKSMTIKEVVKYACDKLELKNSLDCLNGYLKAKATVKATIACDNAEYTCRKSKIIQDYLK